MQELTDFPKDRATKTFSEELDPRRQSYTSSTVGELNSGSFPLASLKSNESERKSKQIAPEKRASFVKRNLNIKIEETGINSNRLSSSSDEG